MGRCEPPLFKAKAIGLAAVIVVMVSALSLAEVRRDPKAKAAARVR